MCYHEDRSSTYFALCKLNYTLMSTKESGRNFDKQYAKLTKYHADRFMSLVKYLFHNADRQPQ